MEDAAQKLYKEKNKDLDLEREVDSFAMWGFWLCVSFSFLMFIPIVNIFAFFVAIISLILGIMSLARISKNTKLKGKGFAVAAIIISSIEIFSLLMFFVILLIGFGRIWP